MDTKINIEKSKIGRDEMNVLIDINEFLLNYSEIKKTNKTKPILSKYERTKIIGLRAEQLARGSNPLITVPKHITNTIEIAEMELEQRKSPYILERRIGNKVDYWKLEDLNY